MPSNWPGGKNTSFACKFDLYYPFFFLSVEALSYFLAPSPHLLFQDRTITECV